MTPWLMGASLAATFFVLWAILTVPMYVLVDRLLIRKGRAQGMEGIIIVGPPSAIAFIGTFAIWAALLF